MAEAGAGRKGGEGDRDHKARSKRWTEKSEAKQRRGKDQFLSEVEAILPVQGAEAFQQLFPSQPRDESHVPQDCVHRANASSFWLAWEINSVSLSCSYDLDIKGPVLLC